MGPYLGSPITTKNTKIDGNSRIKYSACGMQGWRISMEDAHIANLKIGTDLGEDISLFGVFDGHGGHEVAKFVEKHFVQELEKNPNFKTKIYGQALTETFLKMDNLLETKEGKAEIISLKKEKEEGGGSEGMEDTFAEQKGCTANVILLTKNEIICANAGDSRCILSRGGKPVEMSFDHKPDVEKEKERITKAGGAVFEGRVNGNLNLSRAIGDLEYKKNAQLKYDEQLIISKPEIISYKIDKQDEFFIIGCDGIWECWSNKEIVDFVYEKLKANVPIKDVSEQLLDALLAKDTASIYGLDNMTCIIVTFNNAFPEKKK